MSIHARIRRMENRVAAVKLDTRVRFFDGHEEYNEAVKRGGIGKNDICFIDDIPDD